MDSNRLKSLRVKQLIFINACLCISFHYPAVSFLFYNRHLGIFIV